MRKESKAGKRKNSKTTNLALWQRRQDELKRQSNSVSFDFENTMLGFRTIWGSNREDAIKNAEKLGYSENDIVRRKRR